MFILWNVKDNVDGYLVQAVYKRVFITAWMCFTICGRKRWINQYFYIDWWYWDRGYYSALPLSSTEYFTVSVSSRSMIFWSVCISALINCFQQQAAVLSGRALMRLLETPSPAPSSRQTNLVTCWWALCSIEQLKNSTFHSGFGVDHNRTYRSVIFGLTYTTLLDLC